MSQVVCSKVRFYWCLLKITLPPYNLNRIAGILTIRRKTQYNLSNSQQCEWEKIVKKMGEFGGQNAHSTLNTDCESGV